MHQVHCSSTWSLHKRRMVRIAPQTLFLAAFFSQAPHTDRNVPTRRIELHGCSFAALFLLREPTERMQLRPNCIFFNFQCLRFADLTSHILLTFSRLTALRKQGSSTLARLTRSNKSLWN
uniref:(northern house mosquito) hypothetical protein n=1 Tax=Culex pipiens TaxID=7175 RepID=A0A8D8BDM2_CULPI